MYYRYVSTVTEVCSYTVVHSGGSRIYEKGEGGGECIPLGGCGGMLPQNLFRVGAAELVEVNL